MQKGGDEKLKEKEKETSNPQWVPKVIVHPPPSTVGSMPRKNIIAPNESHLLISSRNGRSGSHNEST
jgi:hypothetical protein